MTSTYMEELTCLQVEDLIREERIALVYFGASEHLEVGGEMHYLHSLTTLDRFTYPEQPILFYYVSDEECKRKRSLVVHEHSLVMYVNEATLPFVAESPSFDLSPTNVLNWVSMCITQGKMGWHRRAASTVLRFNFNALVYIVGGQDD